MEVKLMNGKLDDRLNLLTDVSKAFKESIFSDITFDMADGLNISTNKFMLACRVPYFVNFLFGEMAAENLTTKIVPLKCCSSKTFKEILKFVWEGEISFSDMDMQSLLNLLETSRFFCIERLVDAIGEYFKFLLAGMKVNFKDCLYAFEFTEHNNFAKASELFLDYIDKHVPRINVHEEFGNLSESSMRRLLNYDKRKCTEMERFTVFTKWLENKEKSSQVDVKEFLNLFDLRRFDEKDLKQVRKSNLFNDKDICDILEEKLESEIKENEAVKFVVSTVSGHTNVELEQYSRAEFIIPFHFQSHFINHVDFCIGIVSCLYSYTLECSQDGVHWTELLRRENVTGGYQQMYFDRRKVKYIAVKLNKGIIPCPLIICDVTAGLI